jgi:hypothetical protein
MNGDRCRGILSAVEGRPPTGFVVDESPAGDSSEK